MKRDLTITMTIVFVGTIVVLASVAYSHSKRDTLDATHCSCENNEPPDNP